MPAAAWLLDKLVGPLRHSSRRVIVIKRHTFYPRSRDRSSFRVSEPTLDRLILLSAAEAAAAAAFGMSPVAVEKKKKKKESKCKMAS